MLIDIIRYKLTGVHGYDTHVASFMELESRDVTPQTWTRLNNMKDNLPLSYTENKIALEFVHKDTGVKMFVGYYDGFIHIGQVLINDDKPKSFIPIGVSKEYADVYGTRYPRIFSLEEEFKKLKSKGGIGIEYMVKIYCTYSGVVAIKIRVGGDWMVLYSNGDWQEYSIFKQEILLDYSKFMSFNRKIQFSVPVPRSKRVEFQKELEKQNIEHIAGTVFYFDNKYNEQVNEITNSFSIF